MPTIHQKISSVILKPPHQRADFEIFDIALWLKAKVPVFARAGSEIVKDVIRQCGFQRCERDDVIIKQGDNGDRLYIVLKGVVSIYVVQDKENNEEILEQVNSALESRSKGHDLDRNGLGLKVWTTGEGNAFGEIALIKPDCIRTASVVVDESADLMVVDRTLYNQSVRDVLEQEFKAKTRFVESNPLFRYWSTRHKKQLSISLRLERREFGAPLIRQGQTANRAFFIHSGEVQLSINPGIHKAQQSVLWEEMENKLPVLINSTKLPDENISPHEELRRRKQASSKHQEIGLLGENEFLDRASSITYCDQGPNKQWKRGNHEIFLTENGRDQGGLEFTLRLDSYAYSATCTAATEVFVMYREQYERFFEKRYPESILDFRREMGLRVDLYLRRVHEAPLMEYMLLLLENSYLLDVVGKPSSRKIDINELSSKKRSQPKPTRSSEKSESSGSYSSLMDNLQRRYISTRACEPDVETAESSLSKLEKRISAWLAATNVGKTMDDVRGPSKVPNRQGAKLKRFNINDVKEAPRPGNKIIQSNGK